MNNIRNKKPKMKKRLGFHGLVKVLIIVVLLGSGVAFYYAHGDKDSTDLNDAVVTRVVDGDTIKVNYHGAEETVRFIGVDTPESVHPDKTKNVPYGKVATAFTKEKLENKTVGLEFDVSERDQYGRLLAYVYLDDKMFNMILLEEGHAMVATYPPNVKYVEEFTAAQEKARKGEKGLWGIESALTK